MKTGKNANKTSGVRRRDFLKLGAASVGVAMSACSTKAGRVDPPAPARPAEPDIQDPPDVGDLLDPILEQAESWQEPWLWRPERWSEAPLDLNVVRTQNPGLAPSPGNVTPSLFSFNGQTPGPTIRVKNDGELRVRVRNTLGLNERKTPYGPYPDPVDITPDLRKLACNLAAVQLENPDIPDDCNAAIVEDQFQQVSKPTTRSGWKLNQHLNGGHCAHTTNLHTHGLHVFPQTNPDGTYSDDVHLRVIPQADWEMRLASSEESLKKLRHHEHVGQLEYKFQLAFERDGETMPHPPGTHWYHPHAHGSTHDQVSSGMAGYLIVEGDVDAAINLAMTGEEWPDPEVRAGAYDYRERLIFMQRVEVTTSDLDAGSKQRSLKNPPVTAINGIPQAGMFRMRPGAVERWRVLNGSVDGAGTIRFMVLDGQFVQRGERVWRVVAEGEGEQRVRKLEAVSEQDIEDAKLDLQQLSFDGITLVAEIDGKAVHRIKDLSQQNAGTQNPFASDSVGGEGFYASRLRAFESVYKDGDSLRHAYVRPNEVYMTNANRTDLLFRAPLDASGRVFTLLVKEAHLQTDNHQRFLQRRTKNPQSGTRRRVVDNTIVGYIHVTGDAVEGGEFDIQSLNEILPPVPPLLQPILSDELSVPIDEAAETGVPAGSKRCRTISYTGLGAADFPLVIVPDGYAAAHPDLENRTWANYDGVKVLLPPNTQTMGINTEFDLAVNPEPMPPRKFAPDDEYGTRVVVNTAEEWVLYNTSQMLWSQTDLERFPQPGSWDGNHYISYPVSRAEGQRRFSEDPAFMISSKGNDHPFHIHINPMWVLRIDVPDENGELHNVLPEPMWMDTVNIPRAGGRVVFRTRFDDFTGSWVNHCHVLNHEDNGMMQQVRCFADASEANYRVRDVVAEHAMSGAEVDAIYPKPSADLMYRQNLTYVEPNELGAHEFPGFEIETPELQEQARDD